MISLPSTSNSCLVCSQPAHGNHFGAISCRACSAFFRRSVFRKLIFKCRLGNGTCQAKVDGMFLCKKCRLDRCFEAGMKPEKVQHDRDLISSTHSFVVARKQKLLSSMIPQTVQGFVGRPLLILSCEPDLANLEKVFIDVRFLIDQASDLFTNQTFQQQQESMSLLDKLSYGLEMTRIPKNDEMKLCNKVGKAETLLVWEHEFMTVAKWLTYCDEFQQLPRNMKLQFLKSTWYMWMRLERIATVAEIVKNDCKIYVMSEDFCVDFTDLEYDISWITTYKKEQLSYFLDPMQCFYLQHIVEPLNQLEPTIQEMTYMLCLLSFRYGGKQFGGDIQKLTDRLMENIANDLHSYYVNDLKVVNYAGRMGKMMRIVYLVEKDMHERIERTEMARLFDIFLLDFSHPEMFFGHNR